MPTRAARRTRLKRALLCSALAAAGLQACGGEEGPPARFTIPDGAPLAAVADTLAEHEIVDFPTLFTLYARIKGDASRIKAGTYELPAGAGWSRALETLVSGRVVTVAITIPEGWTIRQIAGRLSELAGIGGDSAARRLFDPALADSLGVPGPTLEGYLFPETYRFAEGVSLESMAAEMVDHYEAAWTEERRAALQDLEMTELELVTLASIVQAEARWEDEMPLISAVFHNRLRRGMRLQADPTVQYALESHQSRLLFKHIAEVADDPYNTYTHAGLPPGPIGSPGLAAIDAALRPADVRYLYFVARDDGRHVFSRSLREHNQAIRRLRAGGDGSGGGDGGGR